MSLTWVVLVVALQQVDAGVAVQTEPAVVAEPAPPVAVAEPPKAAEAPPRARAPLFAAERLKNSFGVGFFGASQRVEQTGLQGERTVTVSTPFVGVRWWTPLGVGPVRLGAEVAGGVSFFSGEFEVATGLQVMTVKQPTRRGLGVHVGLPIALGGGENVIVSVAPEFRHTAIDTITERSMPLVDETPQRQPGTMITELALRGGVEVFFGFLGVPNLSLELSARLIVRWIETRAVSPFGPLSVTRTFNLTSSVADDPLAVIVSSVAAKYYF